jgi:hypothetical protein
MAKRKVSDDISARPSKIIRQELQKLDESNLQTKDLKNVASTFDSPSVLTLTLHLLLLLVHLHEISLFLRILSTLNVNPSYLRHFFFLFVSDRNYRN